MKKVICSSLSVALATGLLIGCSGNTSGGEALMEK